MLLCQFNAQCFNTQCITKKLACVKTASHYVVTYSIILTLIKILIYTKLKPETRQALHFI